MQTVLGPVSNPGHTQPHEHIFVRRTPAAGKHPALEISDEAKSLAELIAYREADGKAIVDAQPVSAGRDARALRRLSEKSGVSIVAVTGFHMPMFYAPDDAILTASENELYERFLNELTVGMEE
ncbi:MAG: phosphotriesterase, partial [Clostridiales bacterium]|nr:phosphotriesterase [Clostridiales bacterium]